MVFTGERTTDRNLGAPSPATVSTISYRSGDTKGEILGKEHKEKTDEQRSPQWRACCGELNCLSDSEVLEESKRRREVISELAAICIERTAERS